MGGGDGILNFVEAWMMVEDVDDDILHIFSIQNQPPKTKGESSNPLLSLLYFFSYVVV